VNQRTILARELEAIALAMAKGSALRRAGWQVTRGGCQTRDTENLTALRQDRAKRHISYILKNTGRHHRGLVTTSLVSDSHHQKRPVFRQHFLKPPA